MQLDWNSFTPWASIGGGLLIGAAATLYLLGVGRIAGIAGIVAGVLRGAASPGAAVSWAFLIGLALAPWAWRLVAPLSPIHVEASAAGLIGAGLLVGIGVRMGNGCTSGHGVCGLSRFSIRSFVNVCAFMLAGAATVFAMKGL